MSYFKKNYDGKKTLAVLKRRMLVDGYRIVIDHAKSHGAFLHNQIDGKKYLDFYSFFGSLPLGFNYPGLKNPAYQRALEEASQTKIALSDLYSPHFARFVDCFDTVALRKKFKYLFFVEGGGLGVENALKTAFDWKTRTNQKAGKNIEANVVIHFKECFHGRTGYTMSMTDSPDPRKTQYFPKFPWPRISNPKINPHPSTPEAKIPVEEREQESIQQIHSILKEFPHTVAAIVIEPIQSEGGDNHFRAEFLERLREIADNQNVLLIFDEVQTGMGATGFWWAWEHFNVKPDILVFAKKLQVAGIAVTDRIDGVDHVFKISSRINSTFGGNLTDMVRATRFIELIHTEGLLKNVAARGKEILRGLNHLSKKFPLMNIRGLGGLIAFDVATHEQRQAILKTAIEKEHLLLLPSGKFSVRLRTTLTLTSAEVDEGLNRLEKTLSRT